MAEHFVIWLPLVIVAALLGLCLIAAHVVRWIGRRSK